MLYLKKPSFAIGIMALLITGLFGLATPTNAAEMCDFEIGDLVKIDTQAEVYGVGSDWKLHLFLNESIFYSWQKDFQSVEIMLPGCIQEFGLGKHMPYRPGSTLVKTPYAATVYMVEPGAILRPIESEETLLQLFGTTWSRYITTISEPEFLLYTIDTTNKPISLGEGSLIRPYGDIFVYAVQYGTVYRIEETLPPELAATVQDVSLEAFNAHLTSHPFFDETASVIPTMPLAEILRQEFARTTAIQLPREQLRVNNSFRAELMAKTTQSELFIRLTPTITWEPTSKDLLEMTMLVKGVNDMRICNNEKSAVIIETDLWFAGSDVPIGITAELRVFQQPAAMYINISELDLTAAAELMPKDASIDEMLMILNNLTDQWIKLDIDTLTSLGGASLSELMPSCEEQQALNETMADIIGNSNILIVTDNFGTEIIDGNTYYHYGFSINPQSFTYLLSALAAEGNSPLTANDLMELRDVLAELEGVFETRNGELLLSKENGIIHALMFDLVVYDEDGVQTGYMQFDYALTNLNGDVTVDEPEDAIDAIELLTNLLMESYMAEDNYVTEDPLFFEGADVYGDSFMTQS